MVMELDLINLWFSGAAPDEGRARARAGTRGIGPPLAALRKNLLHPATGVGPHGVRQLMIARCATTCKIRL